MSVANFADKSAENIYFFISAFPHNGRLTKCQSKLLSLNTRLPKTRFILEIRYSTNYMSCTIVKVWTRDKVLYGLDTVMI